jgi:hypothetical protein
MLTWIKFSEMTPERWFGSKAGDKTYLCLWGKGPMAIADWDFQIAMFSYRESRSVRSPDYWAEINPPLVKRSGISPMGTDQQTLDALQKLISPLIEAKFMPCFKKEPPMPEQPLCKDCRWIYLEDYCHIVERHHNAYCKHPKAHSSLVTGEPLGNCAGLRYGASLDNCCGPEGRWFEAKEEEKIMCEAKSGVNVIFKGADESKVTSAQENLALATKIMDLIINAGVKNERAIDILMVAVQLSCPDYDVSLKISNRYQ